MKLNERLIELIMLRQGAMFRDKEFDLETEMISDSILNLKPNILHETKYAGDAFRKVLSKNMEFLANTFLLLGSSRTYEGENIFINRTKPIPSDIIRFIKKDLVDPVTKKRMISPTLIVVIYILDLLFRANFTGEIGGGNFDSVEEEVNGLINILENVAFYEFRDDLVFEISRRRV